MGRVLDLDKIVSDYDIIKIGGKELKIGNLKTETILYLQKVSQSADKAKDDPKKALSLLSETAYEILKSDNPDITQTEIEGWGMKGLMAFFSWFNEPFLEGGQSQEVKEKDETPTSE